MRLILSIERLTWVEGTFSLGTNRSGAKVFNDWIIAFFLGGEALNSFVRFMAQRSAYTKYYDFWFPLPALYYL